MKYELIEEEEGLHKCTVPTAQPPVTNSKKTLDIQVSGAGGASPL